MKNMKKISLLICLSLLCCLSMNIFAIECPAGEQFSHIPGQNWVLDAAAKAQGWTIIESDYPTLKHNTFSDATSTDFKVFLSPGHHVRCTYQIQDNGSRLPLTVQSKQVFYLKANASQNQMSSQFYKLDDNTYHCNDDTSYGFSCGWTWANDIM